MQPTELEDAPTGTADAPRRLQLEVVDALFAHKGIVGRGGKPSPTAQARALGLHKSHWFKIRSGEVEPLSNLLMDIAEFLSTSVGAIYGRGR